MTGGGRANGDEHLCINIGEEVVKLAWRQHPEFLGKVLEERSGTMAAVGNKSAGLGGHTGG